MDFQTYSKIRMDQKRIGKSIEKQVEILEETIKRLERQSITLSQHHPNYAPTKLELLRSSGLNEMIEYLEKTGFIISEDRPDLLLKFNDECPIGSCDTEYCKNNKVWYDIKLETEKIFHVDNIKITNVDIESTMTFDVSASLDIEGVLSLDGKPQNPLGYRFIMLLPVNRYLCCENKRNTALWAYHPFNFQDYEQVIGETNKVIEDILGQSKNNKKVYLFNRSGGGR